MEEQVSRLVTKVRSKLEDLPADQRLRMLSPCAPSRCTWLRNAVIGIAGIPGSGITPFPSPNLEHQTTNTEKAKQPSQSW